MTKVIITASFDRLAKCLICKFSVADETARTPWENTYSWRRWRPSGSFYVAKLADEALKDHGKIPSLIRAKIYPIGRVIVKTLPFPAVLITLNAPPCASVTIRAMNNPCPKPRGSISLPSVVRGSPR